MLLACGAPKRFCINRSGLSSVGVSHKAMLIIVFQMDNIIQRTNSHEYKSVSKICTDLLYVRLGYLIVIGFRAWHLSGVPHHLRVGVHFQKG